MPDSDSDEVQDACNHLVLDLLTEEDKADVCGFILKPASPGAQFFGVPSITEEKVIPSKVRRQVAVRLKIMAGIDITANVAQVGYIKFTIHKGPVCLIVQNRPSKVGEEIMIRLAKEGDPTLPVFSE